MNNENIKKHNFKKGKSGNPKGRPPKLPGLDELLAKVLGEEKEGIAAAEVILKALRAKAARGDTRAAEILLERAYGKVRQDYDLSTKGRPLENLITKIEIIKTVRDERRSESDNTQGLDQS